MRKSDHKVDLSIELKSSALVQLTQSSLQKLNQTRIFCTWLPSETRRELQSAVTLLARRVPSSVLVPHIVARNLRSQQELIELINEFIQVDQVQGFLFLGGERQNPAGELLTGSSAIRAVSQLVPDYFVQYFAAYPQSIPPVSSSLVSEKLLHIEVLTRNGEIVTQLLPSVESLRIFWSDVRQYQFKRIHISIPVGNDDNRLGKFAGKYFMQREAESLLKVANNPLGFIQALLSCVPNNERNAIKGIHLIPFCEVEQLFYWLRRIKAYIH